MKLEQPKPSESYKVMIWNALIGKMKGTLRSKKRSKRDDVREYNKTHTVQLPLRTTLGPPSLYTHYYDKDGNRVNLPSNSEEAEA